MRFFRRLRRDLRGATIIEFAIVMPVMMILIMGMSELAYQAYVEATLAGAIQKAGRDSTIQSANTSVIDARVMAQVWQVAKTATYTSTRESYAQFGNIAPEPFVDNDKNGVYDAKTDCFTDLNGNKTWDADPGVTGQGGASDAAVYTVTVTYNRLFPVVGLLGWPNTKTITSSTVLKNQPYTSQIDYAPTQVCPS